MSLSWLREALTLHEVIACELGGVGFSSSKNHILIGSKIEAELIWIRFESKGIQVYNFSRCRILAILGERYGISIDLA